MRTRTWNRRLFAAAAVTSLSLLSTACGNRLPADELLSLQTGTAAQAVATAQAGDGGGARPADPGQVPAGGSAPGTASPGSAAGQSSKPPTPGRATGASTPAPGGTAVGCASPGAPIVLGQVGTFSGIIGASVGTSRQGLAVWAQDVNARGGIACHPVKLVQRDDGADPSRSSAAVRSLVQDDKAVAIVGAFVPTSIAGFRSAVEQLKVPAVGGDALNPDWTQSPMLFPQGATFDTTVYGAIKQSADRGKKKIAIMYCVEASNCQGAYRAIKDRLAAKAGQTVVYETQVTITATDYTAQCQSARAAGADVLALAVDGSAISRIARSCGQLGYNPPIATSAVAINPSQATDPNVNKSTVSLGTIVFPWMQADNAAMRDYQAAMKRYAPDVPSDGSTSAAWAAGKLFEAAMANVGDKARGPVTTALVLEGLGKIKNETLGGLAPPFSFSPRQARAPENRCYFEALLTGGSWTAPAGSKLRCMP